VLGEWAKQTKLLLPSIKQCRFRIGRRCQRTAGEAERILVDTAHNRFSHPNVLISKALRLPYSTFIINKLAYLGVHRELELPP